MYRSHCILSLILFILLTYSCNKADSIDIDSSKSPITGAIMIDPTIFFGVGTPIPLQIINPPGATAATVVSERNPSSLTLELVTPLDPNTSDTITFTFGTNDTSSVQIRSVAGSNDNTYTFDPALQASQAVLTLYLDDADCIEQKYYIVAVDSVTNVPQQLAFSTRDLDKCAFVATNDGKGWQGNFAIDGKLNDDARGFADNACNSSSSKPSNFPVASTYKALLSVTGPSNGTKTRGIQYNDWPLLANTSYYFGIHSKKMFTTDAGRIYDFNPEISQTLSNGLVWTGLLPNWSDATLKNFSECNALGPSGAPLTSWSSKLITISGIVGNLAAKDSNLISKEASSGLPDYNTCDKSRYFLCIAQ
ncbi:DUF1554 domain-containing protein [Leptospira sarikeiensis]|uniref:DUF1554 domain-containing protein n=1 Tax=Leptospira sarikeiensis TaxID=2484943 RepID=A0A4V3JRL6_9LEPT|nr:DUF1554 domain-containing protein [Leptospira sarikeiensis]TGL60772.1 DUF1554 domain-containing protein [Leptospira sarikeiensis]